jgi:predicted deacylase
MKLIERGVGLPRVAVVGGIHGDEPAGERIVERLADTLESEAVRGTVQLIVANEPALAAGTRFTDTDLNRAFPGDDHSELYEAALAARLVQLLQGADAVLALHTSHSAPPPFAIFSRLTDSVRRTVSGLPVDYALDSGSLRSTTLDSVVPHTVSLEAGRQGSDEAVEFGYEATRAYLRAHGSIRDAEPTFSEVRVVEGIEEVPKGGGDPRLAYSNFEEIPEGEVFARDDVYTHRVEESGLVPVLASEHGYEDIFGIYGRFAGSIEPPRAE